MRFLREVLKVEPMIKTLFGVVLCSAGCLAIWLLSLTAVSNEELAIGSVCALVSGAAGVAVMRDTGVRWSLQAVPVRPLLRLPVAIVSDSAQVLIRPLRRRPTTKLVAVNLPRRGGSAAATTSRIVATLAVTSTPGTLVLDVDERNGRMTLHSLEFPGPHLERGFENT